MDKSQVYSIGLDLGTSSVKGVLMSEKGEVLSSLSSGFEYEDAFLSDSSKYIGIDAEKYYSVICYVIKQLARNVSADRINGIAMVSASGNTLLCNDSGEPLIKAYSWTNMPMEKEFKTVFGDIDTEYIAQISGWQFYGTFPLAHLSHIKVHEPNLLKKAKHICMTTEYVLYKLTGKWGIDCSTATPFYLYNQLSGKWHKPFLSALNIPEEKLPDIYDSGYQLGTITSVSANDTGLREGTKVFLGCFDHSGAARASGIKEEGQLLISCGTSWVCFFPYNNREKILAQNLLCDPYLSPEGPWGAIFSLPKIAYKINSIISRYISDKEDKFDKFNELAAQAKSGADGLRINLMTDAEKDLSGYLKKDIARAVMEGTAYALKERLDLFAKTGIKFKSSVMAGGPSQSKIWREILSEILGIQTEVKFGSYSGAAGAAEIALSNLY
jgi:sugar (pentulose or hexulose) kinase